MAAFRIVLETFELVVPGGVRRVSWLFQHETDWKVVSEYPGASTEQCDRGRGMVWRRQITLELPLGARLMRVESLPGRAPAKDPLAYLWGPPSGSKREVRRSYFIVEQGGKLERLPAPSP